MAGWWSLQAVLTLAIVSDMLLWSTDFGAWAFWVLFIGGVQGDSLPTARRVWELARVEGADLP